MSDDNSERGSSPWAMPKECPVCGGMIEHYIKVLGVRGICPHCRTRVSHRISKKIREEVRSS